MSAAKDEVAASGSEGGEFSPTLAAALSAIDEISNEVASLAGDEHASQIIEVLAHIAMPYSESASRLLLNGLLGYNLHLATHRYGSHVVQTILGLISQIDTKKTDLALHEDSPQLSTDQLPTLEHLITGMLEELSPMASQLAVHVCGSHVLRSLICLLGGVALHQSGGPPPSMDNLRRGKQKSKKKKKKKASDDQQQHAGVMDLQYLHENRLEGLAERLPEFVNALFGSQQHGELQQMACHPSAGPLLVISLRVLTYATSPAKKEWQNKPDTSNFRLGVLKEQPQFELDSPTHDLVRRILCLDTEDQVGDVIYGMSGEPRGSHVLETLMRICPDEIYSIMFEKGGFAQSLQEYVEHDVSNFVIQTLLNTIRSKEHAETVLKGIEKMIISGYIVDGKNRRGSVLWRAMELAANHQAHQESLLKALRIGMGIKINGKPAEQPPAEDGTKKKKQRQKASSIPLQDCVVPLLKIQAPASDGSRVTLDVEACRAMHHMLRFAPRLIGDLLDGISNNLSQQELEWITKDGLGSRCIIDGILEGPMNEKVFDKAATQLLNKLGGRWVALACDRVGHHTVQKLFRVLRNDDLKATLTSELAQNANRLGGNAMGRSVTEACLVKEFMEGENAWNDALRKTRQNVDWLEELEATTTTTKKKRKRTRKSEAVGEKKPKVSAVDAIVNTISDAVDKQ